MNLVKIQWFNGVTYATSVDRSGYRLTAVFRNGRLIRVLRYPARLLTPQPERSAFPDHGKAERFAVLSANKQEKGAP